MAFENGVNWKPESPELRGRHRTFASALDAACGDLLVERNEFFDSLADRWKGLFPNLPARPGRYEGGMIFVYVANAPTSWALRSRLPEIRRRIEELPGAPKRVDVRLEIRR